MFRNTMALVASLGLLVAAQAGAAERVKKAAQKELTFEGDVTSVNLPARQFTVKGTDKGQAGEMTFHLGHKASIFIDGQRSLLGGLEKGEPVTVTYEMNGSVPLATRLHRHKRAT